MSDFSISLSDIILVDGFAEAYGQGNQKEILKHLYNSGMDITKTITEVTYTHRNLQNNVVNCMRYEGQERSEPSWIKSGKASIDTIIDSCNDPFMKGDLLAKCRSGTSSEQSWVSVLEQDFKKK